MNKKKNKQVKQSLKTLQQNSIKIKPNIGNKKNQKDQQQKSFNRIPKYPLISNYNDNYCEILYESYDKSQMQTVAGVIGLIACIIFFIDYCFIHLFIISRLDYLNFFLFFIFITVLLLLYVYPILKVFFKQPNFQPIVFQRNQRKVYIYSYHIPLKYLSLTVGYYGEKIPKKPTIFIWDWQDVYFLQNEREIDSSFRYKGSHVKDITHIFSLFICNRLTGECVRIAQCHRFEQWSDSIALERVRHTYAAYSDWFEAYMNYQDESIEKPSNSTSCHYVWEQMASKQFRNNF